MVLAIAEAAQNIVKHAFKNAASPNELMVVQISENNKLQIAFYDRGTPLIKERNIGKLIMSNGGSNFLFKEWMLQNLVMQKPGLIISFN